MVTQQIGHNFPQLQETHGTTKGGLASPTMFNVAVDSVVWHWLLIYGGGWSGSPPCTGIHCGLESGIFLRGRWDSRI